MTLQAGISLQKNQQLKHKIFSMLVEGTDPEHNILVGRTYRDAPEIDGLMIAEGTAEVGDMLSVRVKGAMQHDLYGKSFSLRPSTTPYPLHKKQPGENCITRLFFCVTFMALALPSGAAFPPSAGWASHPAA